MNEKSNVTINKITDYTPTEETPTNVCISGHITELKAIQRENNNTLKYIKRINADEYVDKRTGEVKQYVHHEHDENYHIKNLNRSLDKLRKLINTNFTGMINELHITLTYAEKTTDFDKVNNDFKKFWNKLKYHYSNLEFIRIIEPHADGAFHIHVLVKSNEFKKLFIPKNELLSLWGHGFVYVVRTEGNDNIGLYFTPKMKKSDKDEIGRKRIMKSERYLFYPHNKRIYSSSKGIKQPTKFKTTYEKALKLVDEKNLVYSNVIEIKIQNEDSDELKTVNRIATYEYNSKRNKNGIKYKPTEISSNDKDGE